MDFDWRFSYGHPSNAAKDFNHATDYFSYFAKAGYGGSGPGRGDRGRGWSCLRAGGNDEDEDGKEAFGPHAVPTLSLEGRAATASRRPDFHRRRDGHRSGTVPDSHRLREHAVCRQGTTRGAYRISRW